MWRIEDTLVLSEEKEKGGVLGPGFRFHPTDEELIKFYLASKVFHHHIPPHNNSRFYSTFPFEIAQLDLNRCEPWDLPERARMGEREWYFYSLRDRKYPTGLRTNRATGTGYWKATGKDRQVFATAATTTTTVSGGGAVVIGMKKTLVFYQGRAPRGVKTRWVMHEYRLDGHFSSFRLSCSKEEWVICRIFHKHGGEKKHTPSTPFLHGSLPPLLEVATTSSPSPTPRVAMDCPLNSLLNHLPPLINFSSLSSPQGTTTTTIVAATATSVDPLPPPVLFHHHPQPPTTTITAPTNWYDNANVPVDVDVDISASVAALDSLLDPDPIKLTAQSWPFHP